MLEKEKRMVEGYEVIHAIPVGGGEVIFAEKPTADEPFLVCDCSWDNPFSADEYSHGIVSGDFLEAMREFTERVNTRLDTLEAERVRRDLPMETLTASDCIPKGLEMDFEGRVVVIKAECLAPEYRSADHQLALCTGGNGSRFNAIGRAVFCTDLYTGKHAKWERTDIAGVMSTDKLPGWAKEKLADLPPPEKASVTEQLRAGRALADRQEAKPKKNTKTEPEH